MAAQVGRRHLVACRLPRVALHTVSLHSEQAALACMEGSQGWVVLCWQSCLNVLLHWPLRLNTPLLLVHSDAVVSSAHDAGLLQVCEHGRPLWRACPYLWRANLQNALHQATCTKHATAGHLMLCPVCTFCYAVRLPQAVVSKPPPLYILCSAVFEPTTLHCCWEALCLLQAFLPYPRAC